MSSESETKPFHVNALPVATIKLIKIEAARLGVTMSQLIKRAVAAFVGSR